MERITGVYVDAKNHRAMRRDIRPELEAYYELLGCDCIDIVSRRIGGKYFDIICDDEGLMKVRPKITAVDVDGRPMLVGDLFICSHDDEGNTIGITEDDVNLVLENTFKASILTARGVERAVLVRCGY